MKQARKRGMRYKVDRWVDGRRLNRASGATSAAEHDKRDEFLTWLCTTGRLGVLNAIIDGRLTINEAYAAHGEGRLQFAVGEIVLDRKLWETVEAWLPGSAKAATTRDYYKRCFAMLRRNADFSDTIQIRALATVDWQAQAQRRILEQQAQGDGGGRAAFAGKQMA